MTELADIAARHAEKGGKCAVCIELTPPGLRFAYLDWPCDTAIVIERLRAVEAERDRWREDAERLADALATRRWSTTTYAREDIPALIERLRAVEAELDKERTAHDTSLLIEGTAVEAERDRWREDAGRLAETLRAAIRYDGGPERRWQIARDDLAAHDAMTREQG